MEFKIKENKELIAEELARFAVGTFYLKMATKNI